MTEASSSEYWRSPFEELAQQGDNMQNEPQNSGGTQNPGADGGGNPVVQGNPIIGTPDQDTSTWDGQQSYPDDCAIRCQQFILEQYTGQEMDETALVQDAQAHGWYQPGEGTSPQDVGNLLEEHGVPVNQYEGANPFDLANELAQGHKVIVGVNSGELWHHGIVNEILEKVFHLGGGGAADHAVVVSGIDTTDPNNPQVIISDPGTGQAEATYPLEQFVGAWQGSNFDMVATQDPAPSTLPEMQNFPYDQGHIPEVAGVPYDQFVNDPATLYDQLPNPEDLPGPTGPDPVDQGATMDPGASTVDPGVNAEGDSSVLDPNAHVTQDTNMLDPKLMDPNTPTAPGSTIDPNLVNPNVPGPTVDASLFDPTVPGPTIDPGLLDPNAPGPAIDPSLLDPTMPGPTLDPGLFDPSAPGPTIDPGLLDPNAPGPTVDPSMLDPTAPGPDLDPNLLDPSAPGPTIDPSTTEQVSDALQHPANAEWHIAGDYYVNSQHSGTPYDAHETPEDLINPDRLDEMGGLYGMGHSDSEVYGDGSG